MASKEKVATK
jgi:hypothetical protein